MSNKIITITNENAESIFYRTMETIYIQYKQTVHKVDKTSVLGIISLGCRQMTERQVS